MSATAQQKTNDPEVENVVDNLLTSVETENTPDEQEERIVGMDYHDQVLEYLKNQEQYVPEEDIEIDDFPDNSEPKEEIEETAKLVLSQLLKDVNNITSFKEAYAENKAQHNQYQLFDLATMIPNFHINDEVMDMMAFRETLVISKVNHKGQAEPVGGFCLDVQTAQGTRWDKPKKLPDFTQALMNTCVDIKNKLKNGSNEDFEKPRTDLDEYIKFLEDEMHKHYQKFLVHLSTQFNVDGKNAGSRLTSWVDRNLHTLEEKRTEYIVSINNDQPCLDQKEIFIYIGKKHYDIKVVPGKEICKKFCYSFRRARDLVGEAAHFILMRYLAIVKFIGEFELSAMHIEGGLCRNIYQCEGPMGGYINNVKLDVYKVNRTIIEECGIVERSCTILSHEGKIMKHDWEKCNYVLQLNPILSPHQKRSTMVLHYNETWKHDLQLFSKYLDKKVTASYHMKSYMFDHKEIGTLINDYVQNILQIKPENIIQYTKHYFLSYAPYLLPRAEYFEQNASKSFCSDDNNEGDEH